MLYYFFYQCMWIAFILKYGLGIYYNPVITIILLNVLERSIQDYDCRAYLNRAHGDTSKFG